VSYRYRSNPNILHPAMERESNRQFHLQDLHKWHDSCRTCGERFRGSYTQKDCDPCRKKKGTMR